MRVLHGPGSTNRYKHIIEWAFKQGMTLAQIAEYINNKYRNDPKHDTQTIGSVRSTLHWRREHHQRDESVYRK